MNSAGEINAIICGDSPDLKVRSLTIALPLGGYYRYYYVYYSPQTMVGERISS